MHIAALGSSFAAGPSIPPQLNAAARRSGLNYPSLLAKALGAQLTDLSASGATLLNVLNEPQQTLLATLPPQLEGLPANVDSVTITAGGNDMGYSAGMIGEAARLTIDDAEVLGAMLEGMGLKKDGVAGAVGWEEVIERFVRIIDAIKAKAPKARIFLVEYLAVFGEESGVAGDQPLGKERVEVYRKMATGLSRAYREAAEQRSSEGVEVVGVAEMSEGHALGSAEPWMTGYTKELLMRGGAPFHPNAEGHRAIALELVNRLRRVGDTGA
jgi:lysophospholipase L1-like esterase